MFHVLLALPALAVFGVMAGVVLAVMFALLCAAFLIQLLLGLFCRTLRWLIWVPAAVGAAGLIVCLLASLPVAVSVIVVFWLAYGLAVACGAILSWFLRKIFRI